MEPLRAFALNCTLKQGNAGSSTDRLLDTIDSELAKHGVDKAKRVRVSGASILAGVTADEGPGDGWPEIRKSILGADVLILATPIWLGHPASYAQRVLERLDAFLGDTDQRGQMRSVNRAAMVAVLGNEDGAHHVAAELFQGLNDTGFMLAPGAMTYWVGEAMGKVDFKDLSKVPENVSKATQTMVANTVHLTRLLKQQPFPALK